MNIVFFLGAGFSRAFGLPVMNEFFAFADNSNRVSAQDRDFLGRLLLAARSANSFLESSPTNLEDILSFAVMGERLGLELEGEPDPGTRIRKVLRSVYTSISRVKTYWNQLEALERLVGGSLRGPNKIAFVTTNYDISIECAIHKLNHCADPGFEIKQLGQDRGGINRLYARPGVPVYKLHGSVNWYLTEEQPGLQLDGHLDEFIDTDERKAEMSKIPHVCRVNNPSDPPPVIIPPSFLKPDMPPALRQVWSGAAGALQAAHMLVFVGYSFPASDTEMRYFLARALMSNASLRRIEIVDPNATAIVDRLCSAESGFGSHFRSLLQAHPSEWTAKVRK